MKILFALKMTAIILVIATVTTLIIGACQRDNARTRFANDVNLQQENIYKQFGSDSVIVRNDHFHNNWKYFVKKSNGEIWYVECGSPSTPEITYSTKLF